MTRDAVPLDRRERNPLITNEGYRLLTDISQHPQAPRWNYFVGDRIEASDLPLVDGYRRDLALGRSEISLPPSPGILAWVRRMRERSLLFQERLPEGFDLERDWAEIEPMTREDAAVRIDRLVPYDEDLSRLIVYDTSGTTGHALRLPHHPLAMAKYFPLIEYVLDLYGVRPPFGPDMTACINLSARARTVIFPNVFSVWNQAGFAKINFRRRDWTDPDRAGLFFEHLAPHFLTGDPVSFAELLAWDPQISPGAMISTAVALSPGLKARLEARYGCPVIDWYSVTETGPIAYACRQGQGLHLLPHDLFVEILNEDGRPAEPGERGEITVTGGRNPYLPLLRYRTGDWARLDPAPCPCGDPAPRLLDLDGRGVVLFRTPAGDVVNPVDVGLIMRDYIFVQHEFIQRRDGSCDVVIRPAPGCPLDLAGLEKKLSALFGGGVEMRLRLDENLGDRTESGKVLPYRSELEEEI